MADRLGETGEASRRTLMASERTMLAWLRTGLTVFAVALGVGRIAPELAGGHSWPYVVLGVGYSLLGVAIVGYGLWRGRRVDQALRRGDWVNLHDRVLWTIGGLTMVLGLFTVAFIVASA
jgi:inner membrane protein YidH